jgi:hypothetical protein
MFEQLCDRPRLDALRGFVERALRAMGDDIAFVVLFGSMARGDHGRTSDFDLLVGLAREDGLEWLDRLDRFLAFNSGGVQPFPYTPAELAHMEADYHLTLLEACEDGVVIADRGGFAAMRSRHEARRRAGALERFPDGRGWRLRPELDPTARHAP